ncbi:MULTISPECIES: DUF4352 domain-containing protein [Bhargavaea]|uniref:DUF4352 domain-containing protein n=1 Tax=Bhargavaea changchunensis TaxID=2134037 RepID=A0ABW2NJL6_9BACL|nr:DUF4352 domain-containing protein [Bhargavaea sp. CC-171006]
MRRLLVIGLATLFFSGCMVDVTAPVKQAPPEQQVEAAALQPAVLAEVPSYYGDYRPGQRITDDRRLRKTGEVMRDSLGEMEVLKATGQQKRVNTGPAELTIRETKLLRYEPESSESSLAGKFTPEPEFEFVKLFVEVRNIGDEPIHFNPLAEINTDKGEALLWKNDIYQEGLGGEIPPGEVKAGNIGFILEDANVQVLSLKTGVVVRAADGKLADAREVEIRF